MDPERRIKVIKKILASLSDEGITPGDAEALFKVEICSESGCAELGYSSISLFCRTATLAHHVKLLELLPPALLAYAEFKDQRRFYTVIDLNRAQSLLKERIRNMQMFLEMVYLVVDEE